MPEVRLNKSSKGRYMLQIFGVLILVLFLSIWGLITIFNAGAIRNPESLVAKQGTWLIFAIFALAICSTINLDLLKKLSLPIGLITFVLLFAVFIPGIGKTVKGSTRWIEIGSLTLQPSDFAKIALVICIASCLQHFQRNIRTFLKGSLPVLLIIGFFVAPILAEPDYGTTMLCLAVGVCLLFLSGANLTHLFGLASIGIVGIVGLVLQNPNRLTRLMSFLNREEEAQGGGYQLTQALYGFGAGKIYGVGLGQGRQQYSFLPEAHTDFIFVNIAEELGLIGTMSVLVLFFVIFATVFFTLKKAKNLFEFSLCAGSILMLIGQALFNMCVVVGLLPTKGISLPFMSYGGSNLVVMFAFTGIILNCLRRWETPQKIKVTDYE